MRRGKHGPVRVRRALIIMTSASGTPVPAIARLVAADEDTVRDVIHAFNEKGLAAVGGRPSRLISDQDVDFIVTAATTRPDRCFASGQFGHLPVRPVHGVSWARRKRPSRLPATYHRTHGIRYFHGRYSLGGDQLRGVVRARKGGDHTLAALKSIRAAGPDGCRLFVILDNLSANKTPRAAEWRIWPCERRGLPARLGGRGAADPGGSVAQIDGPVISAPGGDVPPEAIAGVFPVGLDGRATGEFLRNPRYGTCATTSRDRSHPIIGPASCCLLPAPPCGPDRGDHRGAVTGSVAEWVMIVDEPAFLTGGVRSPEDLGRVNVRRTALAAPSALAALPTAGRREILTRVFSWVTAAARWPGRTQPGEPYASTSRTWTYRTGAGRDAQRA